MVSTLLPSPRNPPLLPRVVYLDPQPPGDTDPCCRRRRRYRADRDAGHRRHSLEQDQHGASGALSPASRSRSSLRAQYCQTRFFHCHVGVSPRHASRARLAWYNVACIAPEVSHHMISCHVNASGARLAWYNVACIAPEASLSHHMISCHVNASGARLGQGHQRDSSCQSFSRCWR